MAFKLCRTGAADRPEALRAVDGVGLPGFAVFNGFGAGAESATAA
ncbi:hypothetical protein [Ruegeria faecimaris]|nr:hypothetical protein [Ruegeria faecimaris]